MNSEKYPDLIYVVHYIYILRIVHSSVIKPPSAKKFCSLVIKADITDQVSSLIKKSETAEENVSKHGKHLFGEPGQRGVQFTIPDLGEKGGLQPDTV